MRSEDCSDVHGLVADTLQVVVDSRDGQHQAQVGSHNWCRASNCMTRSSISICSSLIAGSSLEHGSASDASRLEHRMNGLVHGALGKAAHPEQSLFQFAQFDFKMSLHRFFLSAVSKQCHTAGAVAADVAHPKRPVM